MQWVTLLLKETLDLKVMQANAVMRKLDGKLPLDKIQTTTTLPTGVSAGYRVAICTSSVMLIKEYNETSGETESLNPYSVIPLKHSGSIQMYLAKSTGPVYMVVE